MRVGITVICTTCKRGKAPRGRSVSVMMHGAFCDSGCDGFYEDPQPGDLWPGESEEDFGYPCSNNATKQVEQA